MRFEQEITGATENDSIPISVPSVLYLMFVNTKPGESVAGLRVVEGRYRFGASGAPRFHRGGINPPAWSSHRTSCRP